MSKFLMRAVALIATVTATVVLGLSLPAVAAGAYSPPVIEPQTPQGPVKPGDKVEIPVTSDVDCDWDSSLATQAGAPGTGRTYTAAFTAPKTAGTYAASVKCTYSSDSGVKDQSVTRTVSVKVADATAESGALASTGGPSWLWSAAGGALILAGGGVALAARRRRSLT